MKKPDNAGAACLSTFEKDAQQAIVINAVLAMLAVKDLRGFREAFNRAEKLRGSH
jgi:hypothetical protein